MNNINNKTVLVIVIVAILVAVGAILINRKTAIAPSETQISLVNKTWILNSYYDEDSENMVNTIKDSEPTLEFDNNSRVSGNASCNSYSGVYEIDGESLSIGELESTLMACQETSDQEAKFLTLLANARQAKTENNSLMLIDGENNIILQFSAQ